MINRFIYIITFSILFQLFVEVNSQTTIPQPELREAHTATFINSILYILGGSIPNTTATTSPKVIFLSLDFSNNFDTINLPWVDPLGNGFVPSYRYATCGEYNNKLFLYGGESLNNVQLSLVYTFDTQNIKQGWAALNNINGTSPTGRESITSIVADDGLMYLFGGRSGATFSNDMIALNTSNVNNLSWIKFSSISAISPRAEYGAVLLPNKAIIYMGGYNNNEVCSLGQVYLYDTMSDTWTIKPTTGIIPAPRYSFSSVLGLDGQTVIIFGGIGVPDPELLQYESLYVLDLNNFNWSIPTTTGKTPSNRAFHKSVVIGKYMVVTFGEGYFKNESDILLLDISNNDGYIWTTSFVKKDTGNGFVKKDTGNVFVKKQVVSTVTKVFVSTTTIINSPSSVPSVSSNSSNSSDSSDSSKSPKLSPLIISLIVVLSVLAFSLILSLLYIRKIKSIFSSIKRIPILRNNRNRPIPQHNDQANNFNFDNRM